MEKDFQLRCNDLCLGYDGRVIAKNINFTVKKGDYLCIVGENGSGKSTLVKTLLSLNKPISGTIEFGTINKNEIGFLPQQTQIQRDFPASVWEIVLSGCQAKHKFFPFYTETDKKSAEQNMKKMNIENFKNRCYRELSGGQQQRVLLARAICATSKMLLLDEPVAGLDPIVTEEMYKTIKNLNDEGITIIMISHDLDSAIKYSTHILHIGHKMFFGTKEEYAKIGNGKLAKS